MKPQTKNASSELSVIGIDLHPDSIAAAAFSGYNIGEAKLQWRHTKISINDVAVFLQKRVAYGTMLVVESGCNSFAFAQQMEQMGYPTTVLNSVHVGRISKAYCKTDKEDATKLAKVYLSGLASDVWQPDELTKHRRETLSAYQRATTDRTRSVNRLRSYFTGIGIRLGKHLPENIGDLPSRIKLSPAQKELVSCMINDIHHASTQKKRLLQLMSQEVFSSKIMCNLMQLCGMGLITTYSITAAIGDPNRFSNPKKMVAYLGLAPSVKQSGNSMRGGFLAKTGRKDAKTHLIEAAQDILHSHNGTGAKLKKWGIALAARKQSRNVATAAIARKIAVAIWYLLKGFPPEVTDLERATDKKLQYVAGKLGKEFIKKLGFETIREFRAELTKVILAPP